MGNLASFSGVLVANKIFFGKDGGFMKLVVEILFKFISLIIDILFKRKKRATSIRIDIRIK